MTIIVTKSAGVILAASILLAIMLGFWSYTNAGSTVISACVNKFGIPRIVTEDTKCLKTETPLIWNIAGPQGPTGPQGQSGEASPAQQLEVIKIVNQATTNSGLQRTEAICPNDYMLTGGGAVTGDARSKLIDTMPSELTQNAWAVIYENPFDGILNGAFAFCARLK